MSKIYIDIERMTDSQEYYLSKHNPWIVAFIYSLIGIVISVVIYGCLSKIDVYTQAKGIIRPNEDVGEVISLTGGKITQVSFYDGQYVKEGEKLFTVDVSDAELTISGLLSKKEGYLFEQNMLQKYLVAVDSGVNPFNSDIYSEEYKYYLSYLDYSLNLESNEQNCIYDRKSNETNLENYNNRLFQIEYDIKGLNAFKNSIDRGINLCADYPLYNSMYHEYTIKLSVLANDYNTDMGNISRDMSHAPDKAQIDYYHTQINGYETLISSITNGNSYFSDNDNSLYKLLYDSFIMEIQGYVDLYSDDIEACESAIEKYKNKVLCSYIASRDDLKEKVDNLELQASGIQDVNLLLENRKNTYDLQVDLCYYEAIAQIEKQIEALKNEKQGVEANISLYSLAEEKYNGLIDSDGTPTEVSMYEVKKELDILTQLEQCKGNIENINKDIKKVQEQIERGTVVSTRAGFVNMINQPVVGNYIDSGEMVATIIPADESEFRVLMCVNNSDIANICEGDTIKYSIAALPYNSYGIVEGEVLNVSGDTVVQNGELSGYYLIEGSIANESLYDRDGNEGEIVIGMEVTARIVTNRKTIARYLLEKIDLF